MSVCVYLENARVMDFPTSGKSCTLFCCVIRNKITPAKTLSMDVNNNYSRCTYLIFQQYHDKREAFCYTSAIKISWTLTLWEKKRGDRRAAITKTVMNTVMNSLFLLLKGAQ